MRCLSLSSYLLCLPALLVALPLSIAAQSAPAQDTDTPSATLKLKVHTVLVDVVVTDKNNKPVTGLHKEDFQIQENGKPETVTYFESHMDPAASDAAAHPAPLPPGTFTNVPVVTPNDAVNVLMMDALNTAEGDQSYVHKEMVRYLATMPAGQRIAVFLLSERLRIVQGFTQDSTTLRAAIKRLAANPSTSPLLPTIESAQAQDAAVNVIAAEAAATGSAQLADSAAAFQQFLGQENSFEDHERESMTLDSLQQIARYLGGIPGRKNLIWFVGSIPHCLPALSIETDLAHGGCPYGEKAAKTAAMLAEARVAIYPVYAQGVTTSTFYQAENAKVITGGAQAGFQTVNNAQQTASNTDLQKYALDRADMQKLAEDTGGKASFNNDFKSALAADISDGSHYYTLAYTPSDTKEAGRLRSIEVKTVAGDYKLSYRHHYLEDTPKQALAAGSAAATDPLRPLMDRGMPDFTELSYRIKVAPSAQGTAGAAHAGDNAALAAPFTRYTVGFTLNAQGLTLIPDADGVRRGNVEVALVAYSQAGKPLNWEVRSIGLSVKPEQWAAAQASGIPFHFDLDAPAGDVYLRTGIYDNATSKAGTLEIPLSAVTVAQR